MPLTVPLDRIVRGGEERVRFRRSSTCAACHGRDGQPILTGARDFRDVAYVANMSDAYWFWRLSVGVPQTPMTPMKEKLTEEERWQVIAYQHTFSHRGKPEEHSH